MSTSDTAFSGTIAEVYDKYLVPCLFAPYAADLARRIGRIDTSALELAAGTGILTSALASSLPASVDIIATDLNQAMIDIAARRVRATNVSWRVVDAQHLPFADDSFDKVLCQFGAMFFPDRAKAYREVRRVLRPGGSFWFNVWGRLDLNDFAAEVTAAGRDVFPHDPPLFLARLPHGYHNTQAIELALHDAGFASVEVATVTLPCRARSSEDVAIGYCQGTPLRAEIEARDPSRMEDMTRLAARRIASRFGPGPVAGTMQAHVLKAA